MSIAKLDYISANTKARALFSKLLSKQDYEELLGMHSVKDIAAWLKKSPGYGSLLSDINENLVHRGELEGLFKLSLYDDFVKLLRFLSGTSREFLQAAFFRHEIEDLKMLFRLVYTNRDMQSSLNSLVFLKTYSGLDFKKLTSSGSIPEIIDNLRGSDYYSILVPFYHSAKQSSLFDIEITLDLHYVMSVLKLKDKLLGGADWESINRTFSMEIDMMNILMIYRCKKFFKFPAESTYKYVIPHWYRLTREQLVSLTQSKDTEEFKSLLSKTKYSKVFKKEEEHNWEANSLNHTYKMFKSHFRRDSFNLGALIAYLHLKEIDIRNIITLIESVRYSLPKEEIKSYLIGFNK